MGLGDAWGTREELLHPRDSRGRFRSKWKMAAGTVAKILAALASFNPKTFTSDQEVSNYTHTRGQAAKRGANRDSTVRSFMRNYSRVQAELRAGKTPPEAARVKAAMEPLPDDLILSRVVGPEAFGLTPETLSQIEEYTGKLVADKGFSFTNLGTPMPSQPGSVTMVLSTPKGTRAMFPWTSQGQQSREVVLDTDMSIRITKVDPDGKGGFYVLGVVEPNDPRKPKHMGTRAPRPTEADEADVVPRTPQAAPAATPQEPAPQGAPAPTPAPSGAPAADPNAPPPRAEPVVSESIGVTPGQAPEAPAPGAPSAPAPSGAPSPAPDEVPPAPGEVPQAPAPVVNFRQAVREAGIPSPSPGKKRAMWNAAYMGLAGGKREPEDVVRDLESDIRYQQNVLDDAKARGTEATIRREQEDLDALTALRDLAVEKYGLGLKSEEGEEAPVPEPGAPAVPEVPAPAKAVKAAKAPAKRAAAKKATPGAKLVTDMSDDEVLERARTMGGPPANDNDRAVLDRASEISEERSNELVRKRTSGEATPEESPATIFAEPKKETPKKRRRGGGGDLKNVDAETKAEIRREQRARGVRKETPAKKVTSFPVPESELGKDAKSDPGKALLGLTESQLASKSISKRAAAKRLRDFADSNTAGPDADLARKIADDIEPPKMATPAKKVAPTKVAPAAPSADDAATRKRALDDIRQAPPALSRPGADARAEASRRIEAGESVSDVAQGLRNAAAKMSRRQLENDDLLLRTDQNPDTLKSTRSSEVLNLRDLADNLAPVRRGEKKAAPTKVPAKKATPTIDVGPEATKKVAKATAPAEGRKPTDDEVRAMKVTELRETAKKYGIRVPSAMRKAEIQDHIIKQLGAPESGVPEAGASDGLNTTIPNLRKIASDEGIEIPKSIRLKTEIQDFIRSAREGGTPEASAPKRADLDVPIPNLRRIAKEEGIDIPSSVTRKADIQEVIRQGRIGVLSPATPAKRAAKKTAPTIHPKGKGPDRPERGAIQALLTNLPSKEIGAEALRELDETQLRQIAADGDIDVPEGMDVDGIRRLLVSDLVGRARTPKKATAPVASKPDTFKPLDAPPVPEVPATKKAAKAAVREIIVRDDEMARLYKEATSEGLRAEAQRQGIDIPDDATTKDEVFQHIIRGMAARELARRKQVQARAEKRVAEKLAPATEDLSVDLDELVKDLDPKLLPGPNLDNVRKDLSNPKITPAQAGRNLEADARSRRNHAVILYNTNEKRDSPEWIASRKAIQDQEFLVADELQKLADRLKASRRKPAKKAAPATKVAPKVPADVADTEITPELRDQQTVMETAREIAGRPGKAVGLVDLRRRLAEKGLTDRARVDAALTELNREPDVRVVAEANQKALEKIDWDEAVVIGGRPRHTIVIDPDVPDMTDLDARGRKALTRFNKGNPQSMTSKELGHALRVANEAETAAITEELNRRGEPIPRVPTKSVAKKATPAPGRDSQLTTQPIKKAAPPVKVATVKKTAPAKATGTRLSGDQLRSLSEGDQVQVNGKEATVASVGSDGVVRFTDGRRATPWGDTEVTVVKKRGNPAWTEIRQWIRDSHAQAQPGGDLDPKAEAPDSGAVARQAKTHAKSLVDKGVEETQRKAVGSALERQADLTPRTMRRLRGVSLPYRFSDEGLDYTRKADVANGYYTWDSAPGDPAAHIYLHPDWASGSTEHRFSAVVHENGWATPTGLPPGPGATISHEYGHHVGRQFMGEDRSLNEDAARRLLPMLDEMLGNDLVQPHAPIEGAVTREQLESWRKANAKAIKKLISEVASLDFDELLPEIWQEYSTRGRRARPYIKDIGELMRELSEAAGD